MSEKVFYDDDGEGMQIYEGDSIEIYDVGETIDIKQFRQRWIPITESMPTEDGVYLTTRKLPSACSKTPRKVLSIVWYDSDDGNFIENFEWEESYDGVVFESKTTLKVVTREILAWMRWPELYSEKEDT